MTSESSLLKNNVKAITGWNVGNNFAASFSKKNVSSGLHKYLDMLLTQPMVGSVPIEAERVSLAQDVDISNTMILSQTEDRNEYLVDNVAPHPRVWSIEGYITSTAPGIESLMLIKPTLLLQRKLLEGYAKNRAPVSFKTEYGEIVKNTLIQKLNITTEARAMNTYKVDIVLQELCVLASETGTVTNSLPKEEPVKEVGAVTAQPIDIGSLVR